jgi:hypothetical protein
MELTDAIEAHHETYGDNSEEALVNLIKATVIQNILNDIKK